MINVPVELRQLAKKLEAKHKKDGYVGTTSKSTCPICNNSIMQYYHTYHRGLEWFDCARCGFYDLVTDTVIHKRTITRKARHV